MTPLDVLPTLNKTNSSDRSDDALRGTDWNPDVAFRENEVKLEINRMQNRRTTKASDITHLAVTTKSEAASDADDPLVGERAVNLYPIVFITLYP